MFDSDVDDDDEMHHHLRRLGDHGFEKWRDVEQGERRRAVRVVGAVESVARFCRRGASVRWHKRWRGSRITGLRPSRAAYARNTRSAEPLRAALRRAPPTATDVCERIVGPTDCRDHDAAFRRRKCQWVLCRKSAPFNRV